MSAVNFPLPSDWKQLSSFQLAGMVNKSLQIAQNGKTPLEAEVLRKGAKDLPLPAVTTIMPPENIEARIPQIMHSIFVEIFKSIPYADLANQDQTTIKAMMEKFKTTLANSKLSTNAKEFTQKHFSSLRFMAANFKNGDKYFGQVLNGKRHGYGILISKNNNRCHGLWINDYQTYGQFSNMPTIALRGNFHDNKPPAQGTMVRKFPHYEYSGESLYNKPTKLHLPEGKGIATYPNGCKYEGRWKCGEHHGYGKFSSPTWIMEGNFEMGQLPKKGKGEILFQNGDVYVGEVVCTAGHVIAEGNGGLYRNKILIYQGEMQNNQRKTNS